MLLAIFQIEPLSLFLWTFSLNFCSQNSLIFSWTRLVNPFSPILSFRFLYFCHRLLNWRFSAITSLRPEKFCMASCGLRTCPAIYQILECWRKFRFLSLMRQWTGKVLKEFLSTSDITGRRPSERGWVRPHLFRHRTFNRENYGNMVWVQFDQS